MLVSYSIKNFKSYNELKNLTFYCSNSKIKKRYQENYVTICGRDVLKTAIIVGENAGGKTNIVSSFDYLKKYAFATTDKKVKSLPGLCFYHKKTKTLKEAFESKNCIQHFEIEIVGSDNRLYLYKVVLDPLGVQQESLFVSTHANRKRKNVFNVERNNVVFEDDNSSVSLTYKIQSPTQFDDRLNSLESNKNNGLYINSFSLFGCKEAEIFLNWINDTLEVSFERIPLDIVFAIIKRDSTDETINILSSKEFLEIFQLVDSSIVGVEIDSEKPFEDSQIIRKTGKNRIANKLSSDSSGVKQFFALAYKIYEVIYKKKVLIADEYDSFLNPILTNKLINYINSFENTGQFIFTTHNVTHLNFQTFMKEQMFIVTKDRSSLESDIYSLCKFNDLRYDATQKIYELYFKGLLGGVDNE